MGRRTVIAAALLSLLAASGCASTPRDHCAGEPAGEVPTERDALLVKRLMRALYSDDFAAFERLQPTESQYVTLAWRFGAPRADELMAFMRDRAGAASHFEGVREQLLAKGHDPRTNPRCTRRFQTRPDEPRLYTLDIAIGEGDAASHLSADVFDSSGHASIVGPLTRGSLSGLVNELFDLAEGFLDVIDAYKGVAADVIGPAQAYVKRHGPRYQALQEAINEAIPQAGNESGTFITSLTRRTILLSQRWQRVSPELVANPSFVALLQQLGAASGVGSLMPGTWSDEPPKPDAEPQAPEPQAPGVIE